MIFLKKIRVFTFSGFVKTIFLVIFGAVLLITLIDIIEDNLIRRTVLILSIIGCFTIIDVITKRLEKLGK